MATSIAVAGKGGTGKSTIAALLVRALVEQGKTPVLALDADPDSNLGTLLGVDEATSIGDMREDTLKNVGNIPAGMSKAVYVEAGLHEVIEEEDGFDLLVMGRSEGSGCYCYLNNLIRKFSDDLTPSYSWVVIDNEAGLEHLSRQTTRDVDMLLVVISENPLSLHSAEKVMEIVKDLDSRISHVYAVTNMIRPENVARIEERIAKLDIELLCHIPFDRELDDMIFEESRITGTTGLVAGEAIQKIIETIGGSHGAA
jgi:CO dehydrogenase maturation factor